MPCWYYEKKELKNTPSFADGIDSGTEARYRREGARFIFDAGTKMGLGYDSCATGVVYFHRFYMFHSFKEFHRYVTGACCLFLAGKVEETPKKCKDIIKTCRTLLTEEQFSVFGEDPREEVMTLERILLQTIKFDLQIEHPYSRLLYFAKQLKGDKQKIQKVVQMAWTFINDSMCTMLSLQWEPDIISVSMLYLATRLSKLDIQDWVGKPIGSKLKWWEGLVEDLSQELIEDICHQVLDLYSSKSQKREDSPPVAVKPTQSSGGKRNNNSSPLEEQASSQGSKVLKMDTDSSRAKGDTSQQAPYSAVSTSTSRPPDSSQSLTAPEMSTYNQYNSYESSQSFSSFLSQEGSQSIQSLITGGGDGTNQSYTDVGNYPPPSAYPPSQPYYPTHPTYPPPSNAPSQPYPTAGQQYEHFSYNQPGYIPPFHPSGPSSGHPPPPFQQAPYGPPRGPPPNKGKKPEQPKKSTCLTTVRITGR